MIMSNFKDFSKKVTQANLNKPTTEHTTTKDVPLPPQKTESPDQSKSPFKAVENKPN